jgi:hypothetical protein
MKLYYLEVRDTHEIFALFWFCDHALRLYELEQSCTCGTAKMSFCSPYLAVSGTMHICMAADMYSNRRLDELKVRCHHHLFLPGTSAVTAR